MKATILLVVLAALASATTKTVCFMPIADDIQTSLHGIHTTKYYAAQYSSFTWEYKLLTSNELTAKNFVKSWVLSGGDCDLLVGPGYSFLATAVSPLVEVPWVDMTATSTELSDKGNHPSFSRVIPTDEVGAKAAAIVYEKFGWKQTNVFCSDEPYGRSVAAGISAALSELGGIVEVSRCLEASAGPERVRSAIEAFLASTTKIVFVAGLPFHPWFGHFKNVVRDMQAHKELIFFYSEAFCSGGDRTYLEFDGGLCATYSGSPAVMAPFLASYETRDVTRVSAELTALNFPVATLDMFGSNIYAVLAHDATIHGMSAIDSFHRNTTNTLDIYTYLRQHVSSGATGTIRLEANGDRSVVDVVVYNSYINATELTVGTIVNKQFAYSNPANPGEQPVMTFFGAPTSTIPAVARVKVDESGSSNIGLVIGVVIGCVVVAAILVIVVLKLTAPKTRDNSAAPKNSPFAIVFTDIQSSTTLWAREPQVMSDAVEMHHDEIRKLLKQHNGYEVKTLGDSFMCAFQTAKSAVHFSLDIQTRFYEMDWYTSAIDQVYRDMILETGNNHLLPVNYNDMWNGIRVRVGVHFGEGNVQEDPITLGFDYYGTVVNTTARIEAAANGGQVVVSGACLREYTLPPNVAAKNLGFQPLRGLDEPIELFQLCYKDSFESKRTFPPLRLDVEVDIEGENVSMSNGTVVSNMSSMSMGGMLHIKALKYAKASGLTGAQLNVQADRYVEYEQFMKTLFSTAKEDWRSKTITHLAQKWRIPLQASSLKTSRGYESALLDLAGKVGSAVQVQTGTAGMHKSQRLTSPMLTPSQSIEAIPMENSMHAQRATLPGETQ